MGIFCITAHYQLYIQLCTTYFSSQQVLSHITMVKIIVSSEREMTPVAMTTINPQEIKALKMLVWHLSRKPMKEITSLKNKQSVMYGVQKRANKAKD